MRPGESSGEDQTTTKHQAQDPSGPALSHGARAQEYIDRSPVLRWVSPGSLTVVCFRVDTVGQDPADDDQINRRQY